MTHEALSLATLAALAVHGLALLGDSYLHPSLADIAVPFLGGYKTLWTRTGIVAFWAMAHPRALLLRPHAHRRRSAGASCTASPPSRGCSGSSHSLGEGTDAGQTWFLAMTAIVVIPALGLLTARWLGETPAPAARVAR